MTFRIERPSPDTLEIIFSDKLDVNKVVEIWQNCLLVVAHNQPQTLLLDFNAVDYCDGAGIALINVLQKGQLEHKRNCIIRNLKSDFHKLLEYTKKRPNKMEEKVWIRDNLLVHLGHITLNIINIFRDNITFLGILFYQLFFSLFKIQKIRWRDFLRIAEDTGPQAVPIIALIGFLIGLISTFQSAPSFEKFGVQIYMVDLVGLGLVREMGPLLTAVLLAGRTASAFAAEIGTMKINQEIDALKTMGLNPVRFLVIPRILATITITPILEVFFIAFGLLGCLVVMLSLGYTADTFISRLCAAIEPVDYIGGLIKVFIFGIVIAGVGCLHGIKTRFGAQAIGYSTTQAVVSSLIMLVVVDGIFALIYYVLGI
ncbi:MAG: MlaE family lipid ABC transporter permease subunit [Coxiellaceae bacterium]|jgi:phospholipid/cholesterol/gamma-HCH transport system permease protein|nr:MlaE family lipid ABC transporter permease subunit [Coxiellaceae bacterium]